MKKNVDKKRAAAEKKKKEEEEERRWRMRRWRMRRWRMVLPPSAAGAAVNAADAENPRQSGKPLPSEPRSPRRRIKEKIKMEKEGEGCRVSGRITNFFFDIRDITKGNNQGVRQDLPAFALLLFVTYCRDMI